MKKDLRKEQLVLLRIEKQIAGLAATLAVGAAAAKAADGKLHATQAQTAHADMQAALVNLAEVTGQAHEALNAQATELGFKVLQAVGGGGLPKKDPPAVVASILGIG
ncbi:MAG: hypothetical protein DHS20C05_24870 [Hyphococcus sp.]|nr:MAG: hypothetical protein DHS20C05_24870 [Marinicaulis sp.]